TEPDQLDPDSEEPATDTTPGGAATGADTGTTMPDMDDDTATDMSDTAAPVDLTQLHPYDGDPSGITVEGVPAEDIVGGTLLNQEGEQIANINDLLVDSDGQPQGLLVGFGGFLGLMEKTVAVGFDRVDLTPNEDNEYRTDLTEQEIEAMPEYEEPET
ncbi:MAG TPA: PRC-barrel domain-containing protein, partial [Kiloniellales bacterium]|nr:PRC-barrel domain-containing protein [Kiloniellales bacterium]